MSRGDFWWTSIVDRCLFAEVLRDIGTGEKAAVVKPSGSVGCTFSSP
jgi:hypothetical protein